MPVPSIRGGVLRASGERAVRRVAEVAARVCLRAGPHPLALAGRAGHHGPAPQDRVRRRCSHVIC